MKETTKGLTKVSNESKLKLLKLREKLHISEKLLLEKAIDEYYNSIAHVIQLDNDKVIYFDKRILEGMKKWKNY